MSSPISPDSSYMQLAAAAGDVGMWVVYAVPQSVSGGGQFVNVAHDTFSCVWVRCDLYS